MNGHIQAIHELADRLTIETDPDYKDDWERGYEAGLMAAGRRLKKLLDEAVNCGCPDCGEREGCDCRWKGVL